jgi:hypothetical protein
MQRLIALVVFGIAFGIPAVISGQDWGPSRGDGVRILVGRSLTIPANTVQRDTVFVVGGTLNIDGRVEDDVVVVGGRLRLGPTAVVDGDLASIGAVADIHPLARIDGEFNQVSGLLPVFGFELPSDGWWWAMAALLLTLTRGAFILLVSALVTLIAPGWVQETGDQSGRAAGRSLFTGWVVQLLFVPAVVAVAIALALSVIGIPLVAAVPLLFMGLTLLWVAGFAATAARAGRALRGRSSAAAAPSALDAVLGVAVLGAVTLAGHLMALGPGWLMPFAVGTVLFGLAIEYVAWTIGLGAATRTLVSRWRGVPPLPQATLQPAQ